MVTRRVNDPNKSKAREPRATTLEGREQQLVALAVDVAEEQLRSGTASAQVISHYLKLGSSRERLEQSRLKHEVHLLEVKAEQMASQQKMEELYEKAIQAMQRYSGNAPQTEEDEFDDR